jgi:nucleoside-diphosphate kinase
MEEIVTPELPTSICVQEIKKLVEKQPDIKYTLAIIKPEAVIYRKEIERRIHTEGFQICQMRWLQLTPEQVSEFYNDRFGELNFPHLVVYMSSGPVVVFVLAKKDAVTEWKRVIGPTTVFRVFSVESLLNHRLTAL